MNLMNISPALVQTLGTVLAAAVTTALGFLANWLRHLSAQSKQMRMQKQSPFSNYSVENIVRRGIVYAEQAFGNLSNETKYDIVDEFVTKELANIGVKVTPSQIQVLIESTLKDVKQEFGTNWL